MRGLNYFLLISVSLFLFGCPSKTTSGSGGSNNANEVLPIGTNLGAEGADVINFLNEHWLENDVSTVRHYNLAKLDSMRIGRKELLFGDPMFDVADSLVREALNHDVTRIAFNLEADYDVDEFVRREKAIGVLVRGYGLEYSFGPDLGHLILFYSDFAPHADVIVIQSQRWQTHSDYKDKVKNLVDQIKGVNPDVKVWIQVSTAPPDNREITASEVLDDIEQIYDFVDGVFIFHPPAIESRWEVAKAVIETLRLTR